VRRLSLIVVALVLASIASTAHAAVWPTVPSAAQIAEGRGDFFAAAQRGVTDAERWWNPEAGWYDDFLFPQGGDETLARLWSVYPLFEAKIALYVGDKTPEHLAALRAFADKVGDLYWNGSFKPVGGYGWYPQPRATAYYDDSGWLGLAYVDAYRATGDASFLVPAHRAFDFIVASGWDSKSGGTWWNTDHGYKTAEPLAAAVLIGTELYRATHRNWYLLWVNKLIKWADANSFNKARGLYQRSDTDDTVLSYVEGLMIAAQQELCTLMKREELCTKAKQLADAAVVAFPPDWWWAPQYDVVYLRWMLDYYNQTGDSRWYALAWNYGQLALKNGRNSYNGLYTQGWDGKWIADGLEEQAGNVELLAWVAATKPPAS
jgi:Glycosyl hydrolase family 76